MSYDISFKVKVEGIDHYIDLDCCDANITWNVREIITRSTGLPWENEANNGLVKDIVPAIRNGLTELERNGDAYKQYEASNGWGTVEGVIQIFREVLQSWGDLREDDPELAEVATFWIG